MADEPPARIPEEGPLAAEAFEEAASASVNTEATTDDQPSIEPAPAPVAETPHEPPAPEVVPEKKEEKPPEKVETLELPGRKKSLEPPKRESLEQQRSLKNRTDSLNSRAKLILGSIISIKKSDTVGDLGSERGKAARFMNTYKLESDKPFNVEKVQKILEEVLLEALEGPYDEIKCPLKAKQASGAIRAKVKELEFDRYKIVCIVTIGEKHNQDTIVAFRFLWDVDRDRYAMFSHETSHVFGVALCFGLYYE